MPTPVFSSEGRCRLGPKKKEEGWDRGDHARVVRTCFALHHAIPTAHLGAGVGGKSPHNGSVSYPMRPVQ